MLEYSPGLSKAGCVHALYQPLEGGNKLRILQSLPWDFIGEPHFEDIEDSQSHGGDFADVPAAFELAIGWHRNMEADGEKMQEFVAGAECGVCAEYCLYEVGNCEKSSHMFIVSLSP